MCQVKINFKIFIYLFPVILFTQNIEMYLSLIDEGQLSGVKEQLPELVSKYPNNPDVLFLKGLMISDGNKSLEIYKKILSNFPNSKYAPEAAVKIGEYFYSVGLYSQAGQQLSQIPRLYPRFSNIQQVMDLMFSSFQAIGEQDSVKYYTSIYKSMFTDLEIIDYSNNENQLINKNNISLKKTIKKPYIIQVGAFGRLDNAKRMKLQISQIGYDVEISDVQTNGRGLHAVRVVRYETKIEAEKVGKMIKKKLGNEFRVLYRPESS